MATVREQPILEITQMKNQKSSARRATARLLCGLCALCASAVSVSSASDEVPGAAQDKPVAIVGADVYPVAGLPIKGGTVVFDKGKIVAVGAEVSIPPGAQTIDAKGKRVYPGLFDAMSNIGLVEIGAIRPSSDTSETGDLNPNARAETAINPDSEHFPVTRSNGVLLSLVAPQGGVLAGSAAVVQHDGWTWEDMTLRAPAAMVLNWPNMRLQRGFWVRETDSEQIKRREEQLKQITQTFADARAYKSAREGDRGTPYDSRWDAMLALLDGRIPLVVNANDVLQIQSAVAFAKREKLKLIIAGGFDAPLCAQLLVENKVPVIVTAVHRLPQRRSDPYDAAFTLPARLKQAGIDFCIAGLDRSGNYRNLPYDAATAAAYGLDPAEALAAITARPAKILGVADRVGTLEPGRDATLFVCDGDILEIPTKVERAYIAGRLVDLNDKQKRLYEKYAEKYKRQRSDPDATTTGGTGGGRTTGG